jgi:hypothetical protein
MISMNARRAKAVGAGAAGLVLAVGIAAAVSDDDAPPSSPRCLLVIADRGAFEASADACDLVFAQPAFPPRACSLRPVVENSINYPWSYDVSATAIVVRGLKHGARLAFDCAEAR